jgi:hypothetical protein
VAGPTIQRDGDTWLLTWAEFSVGMGFERIKEKSDGLKALVTVENSMAGRVLGPSELNLLSLQSQKTWATQCAERVNSLSKEQWHGLMVQACAIVTKQYWEPTPVYDLAEVDSSGSTEYLIPGLVPLGETTVIYGDGGSLKSMTCVRIAFSVALGETLPWGPTPRVGNVLYLDWETNPVTVARRLRRIANGEVCQTPRIQYRQCFRSLSDELPHIKEEVAKKKITLVIVDSIGFAVSGALNEDEPARTAMNALRSLGSGVTRLVVAHVSKASADNPSGRAKPFGSAFFWNGLRSGIELRASEDSGGRDVVDLGVFHQKSNDDRLVKPFGLSVIFQTGGEGILFERTDIQDVPDLAARTNLSSRIRALLRQGARDTNDLAEELGVRPDQVREAAQRTPGLVKVQEGGGRGNPTVWGLGEPLDVVRSTVSEEV